MLRGELTEEAPVATGLILLLFLAVLVAFGVHRTRRRIGLGFSSRVMMTVVTGFVLILLVAWVAKQ
jgi:MYXO-CTERM domain-containing protein